MLCPCVSPEGLQTKMIFHNVDTQRGFFSLPLLRYILLYRGFDLGLAGAEAIVWIYSVLHKTLQTESTLLCTYSVAEFFNWFFQISFGLKTYSLPLTSIFCQSWEKHNIFRSAMIWNINSAHNKLGLSCAKLCLIPVMTSWHHDFMTSWLHTFYDWHMVVWKNIQISSGMKFSTFALLY